MSLPFQFEAKNGLCRSQDLQLLCLQHWPRRLHLGPRISGMLVKIQIPRPRLQRLWGLGCLIKLAQRFEVDILWQFHSVSGHQHFPGAVVTALIFRASNLTPGSQQAHTPVAKEIHRSHPRLPGCAACAPMSHQDALGVNQGLRSISRCPGGAIHIETGASSLHPPSPRDPASLAWC